MHKGRLEAFSDGVIAIILTIMVLELKVPKEPTLEALGELWPVYTAYVLSYYNVFLVWLNHHDIFASLDGVNRPVLINNGLLLFVVSLVPFATAFAGGSHWMAPLPVVLYGAVMAGVSLMFVRLRIAASACATSASAAACHLAEAKVSYRLALMFLAGTACAWFAPRAALFVFFAIPVIRRRTRPAAAPP